MMTIHPVAKNLLILVNVVGVSFLLYFVMWLVYLEPPFLTYTNLPFPVLAPTVKAGEHVSLTVDRCNSAKEKRVYAIGRALVCEGRPTVELASSPAPIAPGCNSTISTLNVIPPTTLPGKCHIDGVTEVVGTIRKHSVMWTSQPFEVVAP